MVDSNFIPLDDLVYAPLHALAQSDQQLRTQVVETIKSMGVLRLNGTEVRVERAETGECVVMARICSPEQRESDFLSRVSYRVRIGSLPATEGVMRLADMLGASQIARKLDTTPVAVDGNLGSEDQKHTWQEVSGLRARIKKLKQLHQKITDMIAEQERMEQMGREAFAETAREFDRDKYLMAQANIINRIMEYQEKIMNREIEFGLEKDYQ